MSTFWTLVRATTVVAGTSAALIVGGLLGTAHADPAPPIPAPNIGEQLVTSAANAPQVLQNLATALGAQPPAQPPLASAGIKVPQPTPASLPGTAPAVPGQTSLIPGATAAAPAATNAAPGVGGIPGLAPTVPAPAAPAPAAGPTGLLPSAQVDLPQVPFLPVPLPQQVSLPGDLASVAPGGVPVPRGVAQPTTALTSVPAVAPNPLLLPLSGLP
ncbi:hypothetical protein H7K24_04990 [Mycobacterium fragae]|jgi:hypothetical protein|uniref:Beta-xylosidase n=1 Tax=Mycobacterium fragae TaxID=1260918 RepID=A0A1X1V680_9MYCO|nr:hypothetical protein [Mycobacterium fragae]MCV7399508.1 hypothetical protein [Mycobacterium fragae]ORV64575.1 hypothetical protein AWC06_05730 [Mycobacterium fragae]